MTSNGRFGGLTEELGYILVVGYDVNGVVKGTLRERMLHSKVKRGVYVGLIMPKEPRYIRNEMPDGHWLV